ncbi:MAG: C-GCAxxG-C-C family (seleno)protein [Candidatus Hodarchaeales archaeon]
MTSLPEKSSRKSLELSQNGNNCARSVLNGVQEIFCRKNGLDNDSREGWKIARGFGGGMAVGEMCGAISRGILAYDSSLTNPTGILGSMSKK